MRTDIIDLAASVNSVVSMLKIITKHLDSGLINCGTTQESAKGIKTLSSNEFVDKLKGMEKVLMFVLDKHEAIEEIS
jgi:hypothetical protein